MSVSVFTWVVEVRGDGTGERHQRYLVGANDRDTALKAMTLLLGPDVQVTSSYKLSDQAAEVVALQPGEIKPI